MFNKIKKKSISSHHFNANLVSMIITGTLFPLQSLILGKSEAEKKTIKNSVVKITAVKFYLLCTDN